MAPISQLSNPENTSRSQPVKKRRTPGACDHCKRKKIRCDSAEMLDNRCSNCTQYSLECTHKEVSKTLGSAKGYVESLEVRLEKMEKLLTKLMPKADLAQELEDINDIETPSEPSLLPRNDTDLQEEELIGKLKRLHVDPPQGRFFGKSSGYQLVQTALDIQSEYVGKVSQPRIMEGQRSHFWLCPKWHPERFRTPAFPVYRFPEEELLTSLVTLFFETIHPFFPLFHRPTFERSVAEGLHTQDPLFGATLLLVCALGSQYSDDPRVLYDGTTSTHSAGWKWFEQNFALSVLFASSSETAQGCWTELGTALRMAQEVGAHRRRTLKAPTVEDELWKRAFWVLNSLDRLLSSFSGRQCVLQVDDHDVDLPMECDDEFWELSDTSRAFKQPPDIPSSIAYFICYIKLMNILAYAMRALYPVKRHIIGQAPTCTDQNIIMDLDSKLNDWMDSVPDHLRWDPTSKNKLFLQQSATLYATYYHLQIFVHRPFIPSFRNKSINTFPSLAICTNAARSCCHVLDIQSRTALPLPTLLITAFTSTVVLLLNIWSGKRLGVAPHPKREIDDVQRCLNILKACEATWYSAGRYRDILVNLAIAGDLTFSDGTSTTETTAGHKRPRDSYAKSPKQHHEAVGLHPIQTEIPSGPASFSVQPLSFNLPMYGNELGRLPVYGQFNFSESYKRPRRASGFQTSTSSRGLDETLSSIDSLSVPNSAIPQTTGYSEPRWGSYNTSQTSSQTLMLSTVPLTSEFDSSPRNGTPLMDNDTWTMWSTAPTGFKRLNEWGTYITSVDHITHSSDTFS
ncbi:hypothetical protein E4T56_gene936 [Termitomyces sp. T112]|nr:hypothetical protein E4T56_gene936 [Termitomyces sp. T112]